MTNAATPIRHIIGCMTGTSLDGLDAAIVRITGTGLDMRAEFVAMVSRPLGDLADALRSMANGEPHPPIDFLRAARRLGELHADACAELAAQQRPDFIVAHGQTIWHAPRDPAGRLSWQLFDPWPIVRQLRAPVCYDLRQADLIAGGEGAPVTPLADWIIYREHGDGVVNLGGIANVTLLRHDADATIGGDIGPCNLLLNGLCQRLLGQPIDRDGSLSRPARPDPDTMMLITEVVMAATTDARTLGREQFDEAWLDQLAERLRTKPEPPVAFRSAIAAVANIIVSRLAELRSRTLILAGGGARNPTLVGDIRDAFDGDVLLTDQLGIPADAREAMAFAVLGALAQDGVPITLRNVTGRDDGPRRAGAWAYP